MNGMREVEGVDVKKLERFPFSGIRVLGGAHIGMGVACMFLGAVDIVMHVMIGESKVLTGGDDDETAKLQALQKTAKQLAISSTGLWCGLWFILCGVMAINITEKKKPNIFCYKISFMILSILCASLFGPICLGINTYAALIREKLFNENYNWMVPLLTSFFALMEIGIAIASSSVSCCCSAVSQAKVRVFVAGGFPTSTREASSTSMDYFKGTNVKNSINTTSTRRIEWPNVQNNTKHLSKV